MTAEALQNIIDEAWENRVEVCHQRIRLHGIDAPESRQLCRRGMVAQAVRAFLLASAMAAILVDRRCKSSASQGLRV